MIRYDIHEEHPFFEYVRLEDSVPEAREDRIDVALLDMNHLWPNLGHDSLVHIVLETAESLRDELAKTGAKVRVLSFDVRYRQLVPEARRFRLFIGTGGPGHLDPRLNDGVSEFSQGVHETDAWERPLFRLFDEILGDPDSAMLAVCHSFGLICRWSGIAEPVLRNEKSSGLRINRLSREAMQHPWFEQFAGELPDHQHFHVVDNRLFDLMLEDAGKTMPIAFEAAGSSALTMVEIARDASGSMPRFLAFNHHPEIMDREHVLQVLDEKRAHHEVDDRWYEERVSTLGQLFGEQERQSRLTSQYTLIEPLRFHLERALKR
ncbi:MAG TPA: hypothetical protein VHW00_22815 [Thermoanaerobaculia bacterium]|nr:hypothetical protein [Thermoanaerobaculia bacterium]